MMLGSSKLQQCLVIGLTLAGRSAPPCSIDRCVSGLRCGPSTGNALRAIAADIHYTALCSRRQRMFVAFILAGPSARPRSSPLLHHPPAVCPKGQRKEGIKCSVFFAELILIHSTCGVFCYDCDVPFQF